MLKHFLKCLCPCTYKNCSACTCAYARLNPKVLALVLKHFCCPKPGRNTGKILNQYNFMVVLSQGWCRAMTTSNIVSAFQTIPADSLLDEKGLTESTGLALIPLYSPCTKMLHSNMNNKALLPDAQRRAAPSET